MRSTWVVIPGQAFDRGKTRLAAVLSAAERRQFSRACLSHVVRTARRVVPPRRIVVVSRAAEVLGLARRLGVMAQRESGGGLNKAVAQGSRYAAARGASAVIALHGDLPAVSVQDVRMMVAVLDRNPGVVLAPDEAGEGSNALGMRPPGKIAYRFGAGSFGRHRAEARRRRARLRIVRSPGLARDVDTPENYRQFRNTKQKR